MNLCLKTLIYDIEGNLKDLLTADEYNEFGFEMTYFNDNCNNLLIYHCQNKVDILIVDESGQDKERLAVALDIIHSNFCQNILVVGSEARQDDKYFYLSSEEKINFDLRLGMKLLEIKRKISAKPSHNLSLIKSKICDVLNEYKFSMRHAGFKYFSEAILKAYMIFPYEYSTMNLYKEIALEYGKSASAIEKSMRTALFRASSKVNVMPQTAENMKLRAQLPRDLTNNMAISTIVTRLITDKDLCDEEEVLVK